MARYRQLFELVGDPWFSERVAAITGIFPGGGSEIVHEFRAQEEREIYEKEEKEEGLGRGAQAKGLSSLKAKMKKQRMRRRKLGRAR